MASTKPLDAIIERLASKARPPKWKRLQCDKCDGKGIVAGCYGSEPTPEECRSCNGSGTIWKSPKGSIAQYPGGPFLGRITRNAKPTRTLDNRPAKSKRDTN